LEFARRHEVCKNRSAKELEKKTAVKTSPKGGPRRSVAINERVYMSGEPTEEEQKNDNIVRIVMKPFDPDSNKTTSFFTKLNAEQILSEILGSLEDSQTQFKVSGNASKISYTKAIGKVEEA